MRIPPFSVKVFGAKTSGVKRQVVVRSSVATSSRHPRDMMELGDHRES